jgi:hypothetical protein
MSETSSTGTVSALGTVTIFANQQIEVAYTRTIPANAVATTPNFEYDTSNLNAIPGSSFEPAEPSVIIQPSSGTPGTYTVGIYQGTLDESNLVVLVNPVPLEVDAWNLQQAPVISAYDPTPASAPSTTTIQTAAAPAVSGPSVTASAPSSAGTVSNVGTVIVSGTSPPHNQTTPGAATSTPTGPSLNID